MKFDKIEYLVGSLPANPEILQIDASGQALYESHTSKSVPDHPEIGTYYMNLPVNEVKSIEGMLDNPPFKDIPDHWGKVLSGDLYRRIRVISGPDITEKLIGTNLNIDPNMLRIINGLDQIIAKARSHPKQTLRIDLTQLAINSERTLTATVTFSNNGVEPVKFRNPANMLKTDDAQFLFEVWQENSSAEPNSDDPLIANIRNVEKLSQSGNHQPDSPVIEILPKESVSFRIHVALKLKKAGDYAIRLLYDTTVKQIGKDKLIVGMVFTKTAKVSFSRQRK